MNQIDKILVMCGDEEVGLTDIAEMSGWGKGPASSAISRLVEKGHLKKTRRGIYSATKYGKTKIAEILDKESKESIDSVVYRTAALFTADSRFSMIKTIRYEKESKKPSELTKELGNIFRKVYVETINPSHHNSIDMIKAMWRNHKSYACDDCKFSFEEAYENNKKTIEEIIERAPLSEKFSKAKLFRNLRWESFSDIERCRKSFGLSNSIPDPEIPDE